MLFFMRIFSLKDTSTLIELMKVSFRNTYLHFEISTLLPLPLVLVSNSRFYEEKF